LLLLVEQRRHWVEEKKRHGNRLSARLKVYFPQVLTWFEDIGAAPVLDLPEPLAQSGTTAAGATKDSGSIPSPSSAQPRRSTGLDRTGSLGGSGRWRRLARIDVARVVKKLAVRAALDPSKYAGHSLRAGHATSAAIAGASERAIMNQTGHRSVQMVRRYIRDGSLFRENSAGKLGL
jgi:hypothetical protein